MTKQNINDAELEKFSDWAKRDDWHTLFVGSDIRRIIGDLKMARLPDPALVDRVALALLNAKRGSDIKSLEDTTRVSPHSAQEYRETALSIIYPLSEREMLRQKARELLAARYRECNAPKAAEQVLDGTGFVPEVEAMIDALIYRDYNS